MSFSLYLFIFASLSKAVSASAFNERSTTSISSVTSAQWSSLNTSVNGRLHAGYPYAKPCYSFYNGRPSPPNAGQCSAVVSGYDEEVPIASNFGAYMNENWAGCQAKAQSCALDFLKPDDPSYFSTPHNCFQGSVPNYYIDVREVSDVQAALKFADSTGVPLVIKNAGHDYKGRSSAPNSLALWMHNVQPPLIRDREFTPESCPSSAGDSVTMGTGQGFGDLYDFAEANNITLLGGSSSTVAAAGGWVAGGGHGALSPLYGLAVDNALQLKAVLPNGTYVTANRCQNRDIFYALRGGGGSTFGVTMEMTMQAHPQVTVQVALVRFTSQDLGPVNDLISICTQNGARWNNERWGGYIFPGAAGAQTTFFFVNPVLTHAQAVESMRPITDFATSLGNITTLNLVITQPSFPEVFKTFILPGAEAVGLSETIASRLIPLSLMETPAGQQTLAEAIVKAGDILANGVQNNNTESLLQILAVGPGNFKPDGTSSVTPAWYQAGWHIIAGQGFPNNANYSTIQKAFQTVHESAQVLRDITPGSGAYQNEADVFEPHPEQSFWGCENYLRLSILKRQIDPKNLLTCWGCIGWDRGDPRYGCYPTLN
ncbi:hypothetical protein M409DRAFT_21616 [Zasmidium cellare ATCC 36951]|uniref:FAD-binding PCMH-type domain-containing protein n=1 Tax=Zasmidium cellare ATCC 36951 TaxID=1080233 RepID=A0A6A6CQS6_ZASCE|nr:uncharacterized protein M409DRAFT_21616 [Zasmidium cellare ATCC 36951]KAF2168172.1 hypothetical protein M409DRAFT_21616 [Zasmidium cellare ATCC 36951]